MKAMRGITLITLFAFAAHAHAEEVAVNDMDEFADKLVDRVLKESFLHNADLDTATAGKPKNPGKANVEDPAIARALSTRKSLPTLMKAMKAMKAMKLMKLMKAMKKKKRVSKIAKGRYAKSVVFHGSKEKTQSGLKKKDLFRNKRGRIVSYRKAAAGKKSFKNIQGWVIAVQKARKLLGLKGFIAITKTTPLYKKAKEFYTPSSRSKAKSIPELSKPRKSVPASQKKRSVPELKSPAPEKKRSVPELKSHTAPKRSVPELTEPRRSARRTSVPVLNPKA